MTEPGFMLPTNHNEESTVFFWDFHLDHRVAATDFFVLGEINWFNWLGAGNNGIDGVEGIDLFNEFTDTILSAPEAGHGKALQAVFETVKDKQATAELLIRLCLAVSEANGEISLNDQIEIVSLCSLLGVKPKKCGLYTDRSPEELITDSRWYKQARRREASD